MVILQQVGTEQSIRFIPRTSSYDGLFITDDQTNKEVQVTIASSVQGDYFELSTQLLLYCRIIFTTWKSATDPRLFIKTEYFAQIKR